MELTYSELKKREVINLSDGKNLGNICDISLSLPKGILTGIFVPSRRYCWFFHSTDKIFIPKHKIKKIGNDVILVELNEKPLKPPCNPCESISVSAVDIDEEYE